MGGNIEWRSQEWCWPCGSEWLGEGGVRGRIVYSGWCCGRNIFEKIYMLVILFMIMIKYCHTRSININNMPECFSERLVLVLVLLQWIWPAIQLGQKSYRLLSLNRLEMVARGCFCAPNTIFLRSLSRCPRIPPIRLRQAFASSWYSPLYYYRVKFYFALNLRLSGLGKKEKNLA